MYQIMYSFVNNIDFVLLENIINIEQFIENITERRNTCL